MEAKARGVKITPCANLYKAIQTCTRPRGGGRAMACSEHTHVARLPTLNGAWDQKQTEYKAIQTKKRIAWPAGRRIISRRGIAIIPCWILGGGGIRDLQGAIGGSHIGRNRLPNHRRQARGCENTIGRVRRG